jgi:hypothetical protein
VVELIEMYVVRVCSKGGQIFIHSPELFPGFVCLLSNDPQACQPLMSLDSTSFLLELFMYLI